jgi:hypothetical protein
MPNAKGLPELRLQFVIFGPARYILTLQLRFPFEMCATRFSLVSASPE